MQGDTLMTPPSRYTALCRVEPGLIGLPGKALAPDGTRRLRFIVHAAGWLHSMVLHSRSGVVATAEIQLSLSH